MEEPLLAALRAVRDQITKLRVVEAGILNLLDGEPVPKPAPQISATGDLPEPAPAPEPKRKRTPQEPGPLRGIIAALIEARGPLSVPEIMSLSPELDKHKAHTMLSASRWFERVPELEPATYQFSERGREEYAKAKVRTPEAS